MKSVPENIQLSKDLCHSFFWSTKCLILFPELPSGHVRGQQLCSTGFKVSHRWWFSRSVVSNSWRPYDLQPAKLLCPWDFPSKNPGVCSQMANSLGKHPFVIDTGTTVDKLTPSSPLLLP